MDKLETLKQRLENQIENTLDTIIAIQKLEQKEPGRKLSNWHQIACSMIFMSILTQSLWEKTKGLTPEQREKYMIEVGETTYEHLLNLYGFDCKMNIE